MNWLNDFLIFFSKIRAGVLSDFQLFIAIVFVVGFIGACIDMRKPQRFRDKIVDWAAFFGMIYAGHWLVITVLS